MKFLTTFGFGLVLIFNTLTAQAEVKAQYEILDYACGGVTTLMPDLVNLIKVCLAEVNGTSTELIVLQYSDNTAEILPIISKESQPTSLHNTKTLTNYVAYVNGSTDGILNTSIFALENDIMTPFPNYAGSLSGSDRNGIDFVVSLFNISQTESL